MEMLETTLDPFGWPVVAYLALAGAAAGCAFAAARALFAGEARLARRGFAVAFVAITAGAGGLVLDLERPTTFWLILVEFNPASWIAWGARILVLFALASAVAALFTPSEAEARPGAGARSLAVLAALLGACVAIYPGLVLYQAVGRPLWTTVWIAPLFLVSALHMGLASSLLLAGRGERAPIEGRSLLLSEVVVIGVQLLLVGSWLLTQSSRETEAVRRVLTGDVAPWLWLGFLGAGILLPLIGLARSRTGTLRLALLGAAPLVGGLALRAVVVFGGQGRLAFF